MVEREQNTKTISKGEKEGFIVYSQKIEWNCVVDSNLTLNK